MKYLLYVMALFALASCSHHSSVPNRGPSSEREILISIDLGRNELRVIDHGQALGEFKFHVKDPYKNPQCKSSPKPGRYPVVNKDLVYKSEHCGVMLSDGQGRKLFALIDNVQPKDMSVEIFN